MGSIYALISSEPTVEQKARTDNESTATPAIEEVQCHELYDGNVRTNDVMVDGQVIGSSIWFNRSSKRVKAKFFAFKQDGQSVYQRYEKWRDGKTVLLMSNGSYGSGWSNSGVPHGLTVDHGNVVNRTVSNQMDGLIIVSPDGGIRCYDLDRSDLQLPSLGFDRLDIRRSVADRVKLLNWATTEQVTMFQSHLLVHNNQIRVGNNGSRNEARRRVLMLVRDESNELYQVVFYFKGKGFTLYDCAHSILKYYQRQRYDVLAMINLDTGGYDVLSSGKDIRTCKNELITGSISRSFATSLTNLLAFHYE